MTLIEVQSRFATRVAESSLLLYGLTARKLQTFYKANICAYAMVMQDINCELCCRLRRADDCITELTHASLNSPTPNRAPSGSKRSPQSNS